MSACDPASGEEQQKPASKQKAVTNSERNWTNLEQYMLTQNIDKIEDYYLNNQNLFNYFTSHSSLKVLFIFSRHIIILFS